jgi:MFS family permease
MLFVAKFPHTNFS